MQEPKYTRDLKQILEHVEEGLSIAQENRYEWFEEEDKSLRERYEEVWQEVRPRIAEAMAEVSRIEYNKLVREGLTGAQGEFKAESCINIFDRFRANPIPPLFRKFLRRVDIILESLNSALPYGILGPVIEFKKIVEDGLK